MAAGLLEFLEEPNDLLELLESLRRRERQVLYQDGDVHPGRDGGGDLERPLTVGLLESPPHASVSSSPVECREVSSRSPLALRMVGDGEAPPLEA